jgi:hypothetical protein
MITCPILDSSAISLRKHFLTMCDRVGEWQALPGGASAARTTARLRDRRFRRQTRERPNGIRPASPDRRARHGVPTPRRPAR